MLINCDMGEGLTPCPDARVMPYIHLANIACGGHAGNHKTMHQTTKLAQAHNVKIGAHPSYPDKVNFGRCSMPLSTEALTDTLYTQINALTKVLQDLGQHLHHIKPHGALYNDMMNDETRFIQLLNFVHQYDPRLPLMVFASPKTAHYQTLANQRGISLITECFADRSYLRSGELMPRSQAGSVFTNTNKISEQQKRFEQNSAADSICFHSDNPASVLALQSLNHD